MRLEAPFLEDDLDHLDALLSQAHRIVPMRDIATGIRDPRVIGLRHDVDNVIAPAVAMAEWEADRGYRSTYFILHTSPYWQDKDTLQASLEAIADCGHEIGIHNNALAEASTTGGDPREILWDAILELRGYGYEVKGTVAHGDNRCYHRGRVAFVNDEMFTECDRGNDRAICSLKDFGLTYDANWLPRDEYLSDSGGKWSQPFDTVATGFPYRGQLHMLVHADWWRDAFADLKVAA